MYRTDKLQLAFEDCQKMLVAFGDEVRQKLLLLMINGDRSGVRVVEIAKKTRLTRPAVSHHMQILKDAGIVKCRKEGKHVYYYFDASSNNIDDLIGLFETVRDLIKEDEFAQAATGIPVSGTKDDTLPDSLL